MIEAEAVEGGIVEQIGGASYPLVLRIGELIRFEKKHRSIYDFSDGYFRDGKRGGVSEVMDIIALGLVGGGMTDKEADAVVNSVGTKGLQRLEMIAMGLLGAALIEDTPEDDKKKELESEQPASTDDD
jgi:hypothetical protein